MAKPDAPFRLRSMSEVNAARLEIDERCRARAAIALLAIAREAIVAADREGPRGDMRLFTSTRPICKQIESLEGQLVQFIDSPLPTGDQHG